MSSKCKLRYYISVLTRFSLKFENNYFAILTFSCNVNEKD